MGSKPALVIHHGGQWHTNPSMAYVGGKVCVFDKLPDDINPPYVRTLVDRLGYANVIKLHYLDPRKDLQTGLRFLSDDNSFDSVIAFLCEVGEVHIFCEHEELNDIEIELGDDMNISFLELLAATQTRAGATGNMDIDYDKHGSNNEDDEVITAREQIKIHRQREDELEDEKECLKRLAGWGKHSVDMDSEDESSDNDFDSPAEESDEDDIGYLVPAESCKRVKKSNASYKSGTAPQDTTFFKGQEFRNAVQFRQALSDYCIANARNIRFTKNHKDKIGAKCKIPTCHWKIWASREGELSTFKVKTYFGEHLCGRGENVKIITYRWVANHYHKRFKMNPYLKLQEIMDLMWTDWGVRVSIWMASKARKKAQQLIVGEYKEQYQLLRRYAAEILKSNPQNTVKFLLDSNVFRRIYICFHALRSGFLNGCRPFISLDGCFLKGPFGGQLLVAVGRDGNNQMFPIAWAVVETESEDSWTWFMELLATDLGTTDGAGYTIMSDKQKGLINAVENVFKQAEKRCCARHVYVNFRGVFGGGHNFRLGFWKIAKSSTKNEFLENMALFRQISNAAADDLMNRNYQKWCRAYYKPLSNCDNIDNNMSEVFNACILNCRHKPIITMLEEIRESVMERMEKLEKAKFQARGWSAFWDGNFCYGVREGVTQTKYVVNLETWSCSCRVWDLTGVPCNHAVAAIWKLGKHPECYVAECYHKSGYLKAYEFHMEPVNGPEGCPQSTLTPIEAPFLKKVRRGRPKQKRRLQVGEKSAAKLSKVGSVPKCGRCHNKGHNRRKCPLPPLPDEGQQRPKKAKKRNPSFDEQQPSNPSSATPSFTRQSATSAAYVPTTQNLPMHNRGYGLYTYPNGFQRPTTMRRTAYYRDYEGQQTLQSISAMNCTPPPPLLSQASSSNLTPPPSFLDYQGRTCISSQALQDFASERTVSKKASTSKHK